GATITDAGGNLAAGTNPLFVGGATPTLANNGGPTQTIALQPGSPLINAGSNPAGLASDQRGGPYLRTSGAGTDVGAFEVQPAPAPRVSSTVVNGGAVQRSRVTDVTGTFNAVVTFASTPGAAFTLTRNSDGAAV